MAPEPKGLGIIFHSGSYDRFHHGMSIALVAAALGVKVRFFFTFWALEYFRKDGVKTSQQDSVYDQIIRENIQKEHLESISELIAQTKALGSEFYACTNSMSLLNIARDELIDAVDRPMGLTTFLKETADDQLLFI
jgi:peroxiredoxin family protein